MSRRAVIAAVLAAGLITGCGSKAAMPTTTPPAKTSADSADPSAKPKTIDVKAGDASQSATKPADATTTTAPTDSAAALKPVNIHGLYMTGYIAGSDHFYELVDYMKKSGLNAVVIDAKDDDGRISWDTDIPLAKEIGSNQVKIPNIAERVKYLKDHGIYPIARIVCYADPLLGKMRPDMAIPSFIDTRGIRWPDPYNEKVWDYNLAIAKNAVQQGFSEIQFDYIRFPEHRIQGFNAGVPVAKRTTAIDGFLKKAVAELHPLGAFVSADVFGLTTSVTPGDDMEIGQDYTQLARIVDYLYPMVYPSHYAPGTYGIANPNGDPGGIVYNSLKRALERTPDVDVSHHRAWIQDFKMGKTYTATDIEAQIQGLAKAGIYQWVLWDPNNRYTRDVNYDVSGAPHSLTGTALQNHLAPDPAAQTASTAGANGSATHDGAAGDAGAASGQGASGTAGQTAPAQTAPAQTTPAQTAPGQGEATRTQ